MEQETNGLLGAIVVGALLIMIIAIGYMLFSLAKQGDERKALIKTKTMAGSFIAVIGILLIQIIVSIAAGRQLEGLNPLIFLTIISVVFLALLIFNKKKYGG